MTAPPEGTPDLPRTRYWARRFTDFWGLAFIAATVTGSVVNSQYYKAVTDQAWADKVATIRLEALWYMIEFQSLLIQIRKYCHLFFFDTGVGKLRVPRKI